LIGAMLDQKGVTGKAKPALNFATHPAPEGLCTTVKLALSVCGLGVTEPLRVLANSSVRETANNIGAPQ
jgi:hypothetical protein